MSFAINTNAFQAKTNTQCNVTGGSGKTEAEQPASSGEKVTIGGPGNPCLIGSDAPNVKAVQAEQAAAAKQRVSDYFKQDEAGDKAMYAKLGVDTKRDKDGFLVPDEMALAGKLLGSMMGGAAGMLGGVFGEAAKELGPLGDVLGGILGAAGGDDSHFIENMGTEIEAQLSNLQSTTPPPECKEYHEKAIAIATTSAKAWKEFAPMVSVLSGSMSAMSKDGDMSPEQEKQFEALAAKIDACGGDAGKLIGTQMETLQKDAEELKAARKAVCAQYGITPGQWD